MNFSEGCLRIIKESNSFNISRTRHGRCVPFYVDNEQVGLIPEKVVTELENYGDVFILERSPQGDVQKVLMAPHLNDYNSRSDAIVPVLENMRNTNKFISLNGWRDECYDVKTLSGITKLKMERAATTLFGTRQLGVHINGYVRHPTKGLCMWIAKRSMTKQTYPGKLDQMVAGGLTSGLGVHECAIKESKEEASVPDDVLSNLKAVGCIGYFYENERGISLEAEYVYDLEVPPEFTPVNADGEAESFQLLNMEELKKVVITDAFKFNCSLIVIDFLFRHGVITPDNEPNYVNLVLGLRTPHPY